MTLGLSAVVIYNFWHCLFLPGFEVD